VRASKPCREPPKDSRKTQGAKKDKHQADRELHGQTEARRDGYLEKNEGGADRKNRQGMSESPKNSDQCRVADVLLLADDGGHSDDMIGICGVPHSKNEANQNNR
jgi:hypothetical protein